MPEPLKLVVIELAGLVVIVAGCWSLFVGNPLGLVVLLTGRRMLLHPDGGDGVLDRVMERVVDALAKLFRKGSG